MTADAPGDQLAWNGDADDGAAPESPEGESPARPSFSALGSVPHPARQVDHP